MKIKVNSIFWVPVLVCVATDTISAVSVDEPLSDWVAPFSWWHNQNIARLIKHMIIYYRLQARLGLMNVKALTLTSSGRRSSSSCGPHSPVHRGGWCASMLGNKTQPRQSNTKYKLLFLHTKLLKCSSTLYSSKKQNLNRRTRIHPEQNHHDFLKPVIFIRLAIVAVVWVRGSYLMQRHLIDCCLSH